MRKREEGGGFFNYRNITPCMHASLAPKWIKMSQNGKILDFSDEISVHFGSERQNVLKSYMKKPEIFTSNVLFSHVFQISKGCNSDNILF